MKKITGKRILYIICFAFFCLIDQRIKTTQVQYGGAETFRDMTGIIIAILVLSNHHPSSYKKHWYLYASWCVVSMIISVFFLIKGQFLFYFLKDRIVLSIDLLLWGIILIHLSDMFMQNKKLPSFIKDPIFYVWLTMMGLMCLFRYDALWPISYLIMFGCFYLTDYTKEERNDMFYGFLEGIILYFFLIQGWCFIFRPYDQVRYVGSFCNCNHNALFYITVLAAIMTKLLFAYHEKKSNLLKVMYWLLIGCVYSFLFMTISRTGYLTALFLSLAAFLMFWMLTKKHNLFISLLRNGLTLALCTLITFPLVFASVRYLPPFFHHPVWLTGEWSAEKVHSWDKWDSEKYVNMNQLLEAALGRIIDLVLPPSKQVSEHISPSISTMSTDSPEIAKEETSPPPIAPSKTIPDRPDNVTDDQWTRYLDMLEKGYAVDLNAMVPGRADTVLLRKHIYSYYLRHLNLTGHTPDKQGFQILPTYWIGHAHNLYLQCGMEFGIIVLLLFLVLGFLTFITLVKGFRQKHIESGGYLLFLMIPCIFGLLEYCWGTGSLTITTMFIVLGGAINEKSKA